MSLPQIRQLNFNILTGLDTFNRVFVKRVTNDIGVFCDVIRMTWHCLLNSAVYTAGPLFVPSYMDLFSLPYN